MTCYQLRKQQKLCVDCGEPLTFEKTLTCMECTDNKRDRNEIWRKFMQTDEQKADYAAKSKGRYHYLKERELCVNCGKSPVGIGVYCDKCKQSKRVSERRRDVKEYADRKTRELCVHCGKSKADEGFASCSVCRIQRREYYRNYYHKNKGGETA